MIKFTVLKYMFLIKNWGDWDTWHAVHLRNADVAEAAGQDGS